MTIKHAFTNYNWLFLSTNELTRVTEVTDLFLNDRFFPVVEGKWRLTRLPAFSVIPFASRIACVGAPSVYQKLKQGVVEGWDRVSAVLLEFDRRFAAYGDDFIFYDYNEPLSFKGSVASQSFDVVLADPPYLSKECLEKVAKTIKYLSKGKVLLCTGVLNPTPEQSEIDIFITSSPLGHFNHSGNFFFFFFKVFLLQVTDVLCV